MGNQIQAPKGYGDSKVRLPKECYSRNGKLRPYYSLSADLRAKVDQKLNQFFGRQARGKDIIKAQKPQVTNVTSELATAQNKLQRLQQEYNGTTALTNTAKAPKVPPMAEILDKQFGRQIIDVNYEEISSKPLNKTQNLLGQGSNPITKTSQEVAGNQQRLLNEAANTTANTSQQAIKNPARLLGEGKPKPVMNSGIFPIANGNDYAGMREAHGVTPYKPQQKPIITDVDYDWGRNQQGPVHNNKPVDPNNKPVDPNNKPVDPNNKPVDPNKKPSRQERLRAIRNNPEKRARYNKFKLANNPELKARYEKFSKFKANKGIMDGLKKAGKWGAIAAGVGALAYGIYSLFKNNDKKAEEAAPVVQTNPAEEVEETQQAQKEQKTQEGKQGDPTAQAKEPVDPKFDENGYLKEYVAVKGDSFWKLAEHNLIQEYKAAQEAKGEEIDPNFKPAPAAILVETNRLMAANDDELAEDKWHAKKGPKIGQILHGIRA